MTTRLFSRDRMSWGQILFLWIGGLSIVAGLVLGGVFLWDSAGRKERSAETLADQATTHASGKLTYMEALDQQRRAPRGPLMFVFPRPKPSEERRIADSIRADSIRADSIRADSIRADSLFLLARVEAFIASQLRGEARKRGILASSLFLAAALVQRPGSSGTCG